MKILHHISYALILGLATLLVLGTSAHAQEGGLSVTVTPPLYQLTIGPGETWASSIKIVNRNSFDVTYYAHVVDMEANGETGQSKFIPLLGPQDPALAASQLARWVQLEATPITIKSGSSENLHFTVTIPRNAEPGGHYAAILVGTQPLATSEKGSMAKISSYVSSLLFVKVKGDVIENGRIREFTSDKKLYQNPKADFVLRFENLGNTHLKPEGDVTIYNMWGKSRGAIGINTEVGFGNVLPKSIRRFEFSWEGEENVFDIGRYSAVVTLGYGDDGKKNATATTYFWVVPIVPVSITLGVIVLFLLLLGWFIRRYIRRALAIERERYGVTTVQTAADAHQPIFEAMIEPIREGVVDLRKVTGRSQGELSGASTAARVQESGRANFTLGEFLKKYQLFFIFVVIVLALGIGTWLYFAKVLVPERSYNIKDVQSQAESTSTPH